LTPANITIDLCKVLGGALCPLPTVIFNGSQSLSLPQSLGVSNKIPGIAFKIPDLEGFAQLTLTDVNTGEVKACVQATLSNGWSTYQPAVQWTTRIVTLAYTIAAIVLSLFTDSLIPHRLLELFYLFQAIAVSAFLNLNYPLTYRSHATNFAWAMGLFTSTRMQHSINKLRHLTGGNLANSTSDSAVALTDRQMSPYNDYPVAAAVQSLNKPLSALVELSAPVRDFATQVGQSLSTPSSFKIAQEVQTVTSTTDNILQAGLPVFVNTLHIGTANAFMTVFFCSLILLAVAMFIFALVYAFIRVIEHFRWGSQQFRSDLRGKYPAFVKAWSLRLVRILTLLERTLS
jgi:hypothetical protein